MDQGLHGALQIAPDLSQAHAALEEQYRERPAEAEAEATRKGEEIRPPSPVRVRS